MSALGFGLFLGGLATAVAVVPRALDKPGALSWSLVAGGILGWIVAPSIVPGFWGFLLGALVPLILSSLLLRTRIIEMDERRRLEAERLQAERQALEDRRTAAKAAARQWPAAQAGSTHVSYRRLMHVKGQPKCFFMLANGSKALRLVEYRDDPDFQVSEEIIIPVRTVISLNVASPTVTKTRTKTVPVTMIEKKNKSPVARGLVGGVLLGPAGVVLGAASGLNSKLTSTVHHEKITESYDTLGDAQLIIGTSDPDRPVLKIKFEPPSLADEWMYRIHGAQRG